MTVEKYYTADDLAEAFQAGLELGQRAAVSHAPGYAEGLVEGTARGWGHPADDDGLAEEFLARQRAARRQAIEVVYGDGPVTGIDPDVVAAARRIARRLNGD